MSRAWKLAIATVLPLELSSTRIASVVDISRSPQEVFAYITTPGHRKRWP